VAIQAARTQLLPPVATAVGRRLAPITGLRFLAAANVFAFHYAPHATTIDLGSLAQLVYLTVLSGGASSVSLFFVLSGFVLAHRYLGDDGAFRGARAAFWLARLRRVAPVYFLGYALALAWLVTHGGADPLASVASLGLVQAWWGPLARLVNSPAWSLSVEAFFYATFPILAPPVYRLARRRPLLVVCTLLVCSLPGPLICGVASAQNTGGFASVLNDIALNLPLFHLPSFLIGVATAAAFRESPTSSARWATPGELLPNLGALCCLILISGTLPGPLVRDGALAPWFALLTLRLARGQGLVARVLSWPALVVLGDASYALYIIQEPVWNWFGSFLDAIGLPDVSGSWLGFGCFVAVAIVLSLALSRWFEPRFRALSTSGERDARSTRLALRAATSRQWWSWRPRVSTGVALGRVHCGTGRLVGPQVATPLASERQYQQIGAPCPPTGEPACGAAGQPWGVSSHASRRP
jgi:peptidoglycan/LPS O-acetylase OafA/YrhL